MRARGAAVHGALALLGLGAAYLTWQRAPEESQGDAVVIDAKKSSLERIRYQTDLRWIELSRHLDGPSPVVWVRSGPLEQPPKAEADAGVPDAGAPDGGLVSAAKPPPPEKPKELRGNERADKVFDRFAPLKAARALGALPPDKLKELGLDSTPRSLEVTSTSGGRRFKVAVAQMGMAPYLEDERDGNVYLLSSVLLSDLDPSSQQLVDRRLHAFKPSEFDALVLKAGDKQRELVQTKAEVPGGAQLAPKAAPDKPDEFARNWHEKVWSRLVVSELLSRGEQPKSGEPKVELRIDYLARGKPLGWLELARGQGAELWARSELTASWVSLYAGAEEVLAEGEKVAAGQ
ncbi:MAG: hypothetical protein HYZ28_03890 [Myxococcales bacterium]|nr:hypothetical protein [Myxococcales bacterium]